MSAPHQNARRQQYPRPQRYDTSEGFIWSLRRSATKTILVVDDEPEVLSLIEDALRGLGYAVLAASDPQAAVQIARTHSELIHLLLTDVVMPLISGSTLSEEFRILRPGAKVLFMSAYEGETVDAYRVRLAPGEPFLHKPFQLTGLERTVRAALLYRLPLAGPRAKPHQ